MIAEQSHQKNAKLIRVNVNSCKSDFDYDKTEYGADDAVWVSPS